MSGSRRKEKLGHRRIGLTGTALRAAIRPGRCQASRRGVLPLGAEVRRTVGVS